MSESEEVTQDDVEAILEGWTTKQVNGITRLKLEHPIVFGEEHIEELQVRPVTARQYRVLKAGQEPGASELLEMAESLCGLTTRQVDLIRSSDVQRLLAVITLDFGGGPGSGSS